MKHLSLFHHFKAIYQFPKHIIVLVKIVANASLRYNIVDRKSNEGQIIQKTVVQAHYKEDETSKTSGETSYSSGISCSTSVTCRVTQSRLVIR